MHILCAAMIFLLPRVLPPPAKSAPSAASSAPTTVLSNGVTAANGHLKSVQANGHVMSPLAPLPAAANGHVTGTAGMVEGTLRKRTADITGGLADGGRGSPLRAL